MKRILCLALFIFLNAAILPASQSIDAIAYPNPFDNRTQTLTLARPDASAFSASDSVSFKVYDFNMKLVYEAIGTTWSGYTSDGRRVKPGIYFMRIIIDTNGAVGTTMFKLLIK